MVSDPMKQAWNDVADGFSTLGKMAKTRYEGGPPVDADEAGAAPDGAPDAATALRDAFQRLVEAGRELGDRAADVARDEAIKEQAKLAATSLNDALSATVDMIGEQVGSLFKRADPPAEVTDHPVDAAATSDDATTDTAAPDGAAESPA